MHSNPVRMLVNQIKHEDSGSHRAGGKGMQSNHKRLTEPSKSTPVRIDPSQVGSDRRKLRTTGRLTEHLMGEVKLTSKISCFNLEAIDSAVGASSSVAPLARTERY
ncbi:hypothetical protein DOTSEDRAFT_34299 [Dothistroma septosporum NZE10]|uniref:Uncharacterized protein n=1 Tax=Dothistroma septosporum (strain NZE10 / CBS 128990) TaxID=675120 RepID=N1PU44_DOTSN|nr:hypothetical protein DOTSEDRAFT_34299 [Dothistroma septosporum NZE10]